MNKLRVSVAMATFNGEKYILEQLWSIYNQSHSVDEVVICDDHSTDNTVQIVKEFIKANNIKTWKIIVNKERLNFCKNFWKAINLCSNDIVFLSDQDDIWFYSKVEETLKIMRDNIDVTLVASSYSLCDENGNDLGRSINQARNMDDESIEEIIISSLVNNTCARGCSMAFKKNIIDGENLFDSTIGLIGHDWILGFYAALKGRAIFYNKIMFDYRVHDSNATISSPNAKNRLTKKAAVSRIKALLSEHAILKVAVKHEYLSVNDKKKFNIQLTFLDRRILLLTSFSPITALILLANMRLYSEICRQGYIAGVKDYLGDLAYSVRFNRLYRKMTVRGNK